MTIQQYKVRIIPTMFFYNHAIQLHKSRSTSHGEFLVMENTLRQMGFNLSTYPYLTIDLSLDEIILKILNNTRNLLALVTEMNIDISSFKYAQLYRQAFLLKPQCWCTSTGGCIWKKAQNVSKPMTQTLPAPVPPFPASMLMLKTALTWCLTKGEWIWLYDQEKKW